MLRWYRKLYPSDFWRVINELERIYFLIELFYKKLASITIMLIKILTLVEIIGKGKVIRFE